ncbi:MAG: hypothetical protein QM729_06595 [Solirubrobacterales bacterium]
MEIERRSLESRQASARDMLRGDLEGEDLERYVEERVVTTTFEKMLNLARANSIFPLTFGLACCAIEAPISIVTARYDLARFGAEALRAIAPPGRPDHLVGPGLDQDGAGRPPPLRPDAGAEVGDLDGRLLLLRRHVRQLRRRPGRRQVHADRPPHPRLPAAAGGGHVRLQRSCSARSMGNPDQGWRQRYNAYGTEEWARGGPAPSPATRRPRPASSPAS